MRLIVGLGNPGRQYRSTWHNIGAMTVEELSRRWDTRFRPGRGECFSADHLHAGHRITLMIPTAFMNRSGAPVSDWIRYYHIEPCKVLIISDDHDLSLGRIRIRQGGSSGGHRGLDDIIRHLGTDQIPRLRIGIRIGNERPELSHQVLSKIPKKYRTDVIQVVDTAADAVLEIVSGGIEAAANRYNGMEIL